MSDPIPPAASVRDGEGSPPRAQLVTVEPETPEQRSAETDAPTQQRPRALGGVGGTRAEQGPRDRAEATPPKRDEEVEDADDAGTFGADVEMHAEDGAAGEGEGHPQSQDCPRDEDNLVAPTTNDAEPEAEDVNMAAEDSGDEREEEASVRSEDGDSEDEDGDGSTEAASDAERDEDLGRAFLDLRSDYRTTAQVRAHRQLCPLPGFSFSTRARTRVERRARARALAPPRGSLPRARARAPRASRERRREALDGEDARPRPPTRSSLGRIHARTRARDPFPGGATSGSRGRGNAVEHLVAGSFFFLCVEDPLSYPPDSLFSPPSSPSQLVRDASSYADTTRAQAKRGRDIQGIPWERLQFTREEYRAKRVAEYKNYANLDFSPSDLDAVCLAPREPRRPFFEFAHNTRSVRSNFVHFQLRNLVWATSKHDAYVMSENRVVHWNAVERVATPALDLDGGETGPAGNFPRIQVSTTLVRDGLIAAGGFAGELVCLNPGTGVGASARVTQDDNGITNAIEALATPSGAALLVCANNDQQTRYFDLETMRCVGRHKYPWAVNYCAAAPGGKIACVVGDAKDAWLVDAAKGRRIAKMEGHLDFSFAAAWHPDGNVFATGNQDATTRVWDARHLGQSLAVLRGRMGAIRSLRFSGDGRFLAAAEPADFVHVYDTKSGFEVRQTLDHFGETAGVAFSPDAEAVFVGVADLTYGSVMEYARTRTGTAAVVA